MRSSVIAAAALVAASTLGAAALTGEGGGSANAAAVTCSEATTPRLPNGKPLRVTGVWKDEFGNAFYVRQLGSCLWLLGESRPVTGAPRGIAFTSVMYGYIRPNLTMAGTWSDMPRQATAMGHGPAVGKILLDGTRVTIDFDDLVLSLRRACRTNSVC